MPEPIDISFVAITYNDANKLPKCLVSSALAAQGSGLEYEVWVVDNGSVDHTQQLLADFGEVLGERLKVITLPCNTGTTVSRNMALTRARGRFVCVLDSDAEFLDLDLRPMLRLLADFPKLGIVGPRILLPSGRPYDSVKMLPTLSDKLFKLPNVILRLPQINRDWYLDFPFTHIRCVHTAISCCWFFRRELFDRLGPLDERIFYAPEDVDYCLRSWKAGRAVAYFPYMNVLHHTRHITHKSPFSFTARSHMKGLLYYLNKHHYLFSRAGLEKRYISPLAHELDPELSAWEQEEI